MKLRRSVALGVATMMSTPLVPAAPAAAAIAFQGSSAVVHSAVSCMVADQYPQLEATAPPGANVRSARAYFHSAFSNEFSYVEGELVGGRWVFRLPRPNLNAGPITYYIEFLPDGRSPEHAAVVVREANDCGSGRPAAPIAASGPAAIFGPGGAVVAPAGFGSVGAASIGAAGTVVAASSAGGVSTGLLIAGAAILIGAGVIVATRDDEPASGSR